MSSNKKTRSTGNHRVITKPKVPTVKPTVRTELTVKNDKDVGDYIKIIFAQTSGQLEVVFHHPVGETPLDDDEWVATDSAEVAHLKARRFDLTVARRNAELEDYKNLALLKTNIVVEDDEGKLVYPDGSPLGDRFQFLEAIKAERKKKDSSYNRRTFLLNHEDPRGKVEAELDDVKSAVTQKFEKRFPSTFETMGGACADHPQKALLWAKGLTTAELQDSLFKACIAGPPAEETQFGMETYGKAARAADTVAEDGSFSEKLPRDVYNSLSGKDRALISKSIADLRKTLIDTGLGDYQVGYQKSID